MISGPTSIGRAARGTSGAIRAFALTVRVRGLLIGLLVATSASVRADPAPPCKGCTLDLPKAIPDAGAPLLVVLHGDREKASTAASRWRAATKARGWVLLSLQCPVDQGCKDSWWKWDGDPQFLASMIDKVAETTKIDRTRIGLVGWSGGASYLGANARYLRDTYAGIVFHGGGMPGDEDGCTPHRQRAYFLVGDKNPLHHLAIALRERFDRCRSEIVWDVIKGGDHDREDRALDLKKAIAILSWISSALVKPAR